MIISFCHQSNQISQWFDLDKLHTTCS